MASTKLVSDAVTRAHNDLKGVTLSTTDSVDFANEIYQLLGTATFFDWRQASGTTFGTTANTQSYANVPTDFAALKAAWVQDDSSSTNPKFPLSIYQTLPQSTRTGQIYAISVENGSFRLLNVPNVTRSGSGQWAIKFEYWKRPSRLTTVDDDFEFDDVCFETFAAGMIARVAQFCDDDRTGEWLGKDASGQYRGTGLWGRFAAQLNNMLTQETVASGQIVYAPASGLLRG